MNTTELTTAPAPMKRADVPAIWTSVSKSPCQRLHSVLFLCWKKRGEGDFDTYYRKRMERILDHLKKELHTQ